MRIPLLKFAPVALVAMLVAVSGCKDEDTQLTPEQQIVRTLSSTAWIATSVLKDDVAQTDYTNFTITFTGTLDYSVSGGPAFIPFPATGAWELGAPLTSQLILGAGNQNIETEYELSETTLTVEFDYTGNGFSNGRTNGLNGRWTFVFSKN